MTYLPPPPPQPATPPPAPFQTTKKKGPKWPWIVAAVVLVLAVIGSVGGSSEDNDDDTAAPTTEQVEATTTEKPTTTEKATTTTKAPTTTTTTEAPTTTTEDPAVRQRADMMSWQIEAVPVMQGMLGAFESMSTAGAEMDVYGMRAACMDLRSQVIEAQALRPAPVEDVERPWRAALDEYAAGADACIEGATNVDPAALERSVGHMEVASGHLQEVTTATERIMG